MQKYGHSLDSIDVDVNVNYPFCAHSASGGLMGGLRAWDELNGLSYSLPMPDEDKTASPWKSAGKPVPSRP